MLATRIATGLVLGVVLTLTILFLPTNWVALVFGLVWFVAAWEWARLASWADAKRWYYAAAHGLLMLLLFTNSSHPLLPNGLLWPAIVCWFMAFVAVTGFPHRLAPAGIAAAGFVALLPAWLAAVFLHASPVGPGLMLLAIAIVWAADVGAYFAGRRFGRVKLAPRVSPGKTWEGVFGGALLALIVAGLGAEWLELPLGNVLPVAACGAIASVVGDLSVSMLKRNLGLKDTGRLLPGHGGVLDRIDGLIAALPFIAIGLQLTGLLD